MTASTEQERAEFEEQFKHLDLTQEPDAWGKPRYKHDAISLAWEAWQAARRAQAQDVQDALPEGLVEWLGNGSRGISSNSIVEHLTGINCTGDWGMDHPHDPDDLDRCLRLLEAVPSLRNQLPRMSTASKEWAGLIMRWSEIEASHLEEVGLGWTKASRAPKTYELMRAAIAASAKGGV